MRGTRKEPAVQAYDGAEAEIDFGDAVYSYHVDTGAVCLIDDDGNPRPSALVLDHRIVDRCEEACELWRYELAESIHEDALVDRYRERDL